MLKKILKRIRRTAKALISGVFWYTRDLVMYKRLLAKSAVKTSVYLFPQIFDKDPGAHTFDKHYVYMDRWAFRYLLQSRPAEHVDVGSSIRFLSMASTVTKLKFVDIRPIKTDFDNFECTAGSILQMPFADNSVASLSCLHVAEHIGLGRYGDPVDALGTQKACKELQRVLAPGGALYFALPIGKSAVYFNAHRVHDPEAILGYFNGLRLEEFAAVDDKGNFIAQANIGDFKNASYSCGCFKFVK